jgi:hypothetical protein
MAERRKILIPTGADDTGSIETPHFDTEAARSARPVVPLSAQSGDLGPLPQSVHYTQSEPVRRAKFSPWLLGLVILAAMSAGAAGALALDYYRNHKHGETQAAIQPSDAAVATDTSGTRPTENPLQENRQIDSPASSNAKKVEASPSPAHETSTAVATVSTEKSPEPAARPKSPAASQPQPEHPAREDRRQDERPPDAREARRERQREVTSEEGPDDPDSRRPGRRRHGRDIEVRPEDVPPQVKRANQELHRIREIFEGTRP